MELGAIRGEGSRRGSQALACAEDLEPIEPFVQAPFGGVSEETSGGQETPARRNSYPTTDQRCMSSAGVAGIP